MTDPGFRGWASVEFLNHRRVAGWVEDADVAGERMLRVDSGTLHACAHCSVEPNSHAPCQACMICSRFYNPKNISCLIPTTEKRARYLAACEEARITFPEEKLDI